LRPASSRTIPSVAQTHHLQGLIIQIHGNRG
jgi:hypothetical protein